MAQGSNSGGRSGGGGRGGGSDAIITAPAIHEMPKGLLDFISELEYIHTQEIKGIAASLAEEFFTTKDKLIAAELGFRQTFLSGVVTAMLTPFAIGVVEKMIPVFGSTEPSLFDSFYIFVLTLSYMIGYAFFIGSAATRFYGGYSHAMVKNLLLGVFTSAFLKMVIIFILFNFIYIKVLTEEHILQVLTNMTWIPGLQPYLYPAYKWLVGFRGVFPWSANVVILSTLLYCSVIAGCYIWARRRNKRLRESGMYG